MKFKLGHINDFGSPCYKLLTLYIIFKCIFVRLSVGAFLSRPTEHSNKRVNEFFLFAVFFSYLIFFVICIFCSAI